MNPLNSIRKYDVEFDAWMLQLIECINYSGTPAELIAEPTVIPCDPYGAFDEGFTAWDFCASLPMNGIGELTVDSGFCPNCRNLTKVEGPGPNNIQYFCEVGLENIEHPIYHKCEAYDFDNGEES